VALNTINPPRLVCIDGLIIFFKDNDVSQSYARQLLNNVCRTLIGEWYSYLAWTQSYWLVGLWCLMSLSTILHTNLGGFMVFKATLKQYFSNIVRSVLLVEETGVPGENYRPAANNWSTLSHNIVSGTTRLTVFVGNTILIKTFCIFCIFSINKS
jgi:hypothetical protein